MTQFSLMFGENENGLHSEMVILKKKKVCLTTAKTFGVQFLIVIFQFLPLQRFVKILRFVLKIKEESTGFYCAF